MHSFLVNPLSANEQFQLTEDAEDALQKVIECFRMLRPALNKKCVKLIYDNGIESRKLLGNSIVIAQCFGRMRNRELVKEWYLYTKNKSVLANASNISISLIVDGNVITGDVTESVSDVDKLVGFGGAAVLESENIVVEFLQSNPLVRKQCISAFDEHSLKRILPIYEKSPKHRATGYYREGEFVSPMTLDDATAQICLLCAFKIRDDYFGKVENDYFRFKLTRNDGNLFVYHGFNVEIDSVPEDALQALV